MVVIGWRESALRRQIRASRAADKGRIQGGIGVPCGAHSRRKSAMRRSACNAVPVRAPWRMAGLALRLPG